VRGAILAARFQAQEVGARKNPGQGGSPWPGLFLINLGAVERQVVRRDLTANSSTVSTCFDRGVATTTDGKNP
jgi:hypothetical protein